MSLSLVLKRKKRENSRATTISLLKLGQIETQTEKSKVASDIKWPTSNTTRTEKEFNTERKGEIHAITFSSSLKV